MSLVVIFPNVFFFFFLVSVSRSPPHSLIRLTVSAISKPNSFQALYGVWSSSPVSLVSFFFLFNRAYVRDQLRPCSQSLSLLISTLSKCKKFVSSFKLVWCVILFCFVFGLLPLPLQLVTKPGPVFSNAPPLTSSVYKSRKDQPRPNELVCWLTAQKNDHTTWGSIKLLPQMLSSPTTGLSKVCAWALQCLIKNITPMLFMEYYGIAQPRFTYIAVADSITRLPNILNHCWNIM